jgi:lariat debranching enzyme
MALPHGGWVASNIYYMGFASVVNFGGLRIGGWSGIFKQQDYMKSELKYSINNKPFSLGHHEAPPFERGQQISAYHVRAIEKFRLELLENKDLNCLDVFMTHDWPVGITKFGNEAQLLRYKKYFANDIKNNCLGNPHSRQLLPKIRPRHWFAGHLHCKFEANVVHEENGGTTEFLALHKCVHEEKWRNQMFHDVSCCAPL